MWQSERESQHGTKKVKTHNRTLQKNKNMSSQNATKKLGVNAGALEG
jgi:hypothetical protein